MLSQQDQITNVNGAMLQHGALSRRIYLMKLGEAVPGELIPRLERLALDCDYTKIFAKVPRSAAPAFRRAGYRLEAVVPRFFKNEESACFMGRYFNDKRRAPDDPAALDQVLGLARAKSAPAPADLSVPLCRRTPPGFVIRRCEPADADAMSALYGEVFPSYPFPIDDPEFLRETMATHVAYFGVEHEGRLVALSSAEQDAAEGNVEMTDFATLPAWRGHGLAVCLLARMEQTMRQVGFVTAYTIARAVSPGMNITFARMGYRFGGRLINNTNISGTIESMNVWHKHWSDGAKCANGTIQPGD